MDRRGYLDLLRAAWSVAPDAATPDPDFRRAAVAVILLDRAGDTCVLLIRRAEHDADPWSGHMAFPGGREDPTDETLLATAVRETREEVGLDLSREAVLIGRLPDVPAVARGLRLALTIAPFVFELRREAALTLNGEVAEALWVPVERLLDPASTTTRSYVLEGTPVEMPAWNVEGRIVWGLTHRMLTTLLEPVPRERKG